MLSVYIVLFNCERLSGSRDLGSELFSYWLGYFLTLFENSIDKINPGFISLFKGCFFDLNPLLLEMLRLDFPELRPWGQVLAVKMER